MIVQQKRYWNLNMHLKTLYYFIFNWSVCHLISSTKSGPLPELESVLSKIGLVLILQNVMNKFCICDFAVWEAPASLKLSIEVILQIELKQSYCEILESVPAVFAKLSWKFHQSLSCCISLPGNWQYITCLSIYYRVMTCFDGLYLKKLWSACSVLEQNINASFGPNGANYDGFESSRVLKLSATPLPFCMVLSQSVHWHLRFYIAALSITFFLFLDFVSGDLALTGF